MSIDVIGYFHAITCFDCALSLDTCWIQGALWEKVVSTPCRERVNYGRFAEIFSRITIDKPLHKPSLQLVAQVRVSLLHELTPALANQCLHTHAIFCRSVKFGKSYNLKTTVCRTLSNVQRPQNTEPNNPTPNIHTGAPHNATIDGMVSYFLHHQHFKPSYPNNFK
jgi:hypothetical protein